MSQPGVRLRWSEHEARKPYARPFGVGFVSAVGDDLGGLAVSGADLLYYRQFQATVLALAGELFCHPQVEAAADPQAAWLDVLTALMPAAGSVAALPVSEFDHTEGRRFRFRITVDGGDAGTLDPPQLLSYQELQAAVAHRTGRLYREAAVEAAASEGGHQAAWTGCLRSLLGRPGAGELAAPSWPWR